LAKKDSAWKFILDVDTNAGPGINDTAVRKIEATKTKGTKITCFFSLVCRQIYYNVGRLPKIIVLTGL
jgi:hypothetical protein